MQKLFNRKCVVVLGDKEYNVGKPATFQSFAPTADEALNTVFDPLNMTNTSRAVASHTLDSGPPYRGSGVGVKITQYPQPPPQEGTAYSQLRVSFRITKTIKSEPNKAQITLYNLPKDEALRLVARGRSLRVRLLAGYGIPKLCFEGNPSKNGIKLKKEGADWILTIDAQTGLRQFQRAMVNETIKGPVTLDEVVGRLAGALGVPAGVIEVPQGDKVLTQGITLKGAASDQLAQLAHSMDVDMSIQDGGFQMLGRNSTRSVKAVLFTLDQGNLLKYPQPVEKGLEMDCLLSPGVQPGDRVSVDTNDSVIKGTYRVTAIRHSGDQYDNNWTSHITMRRLRKPQVAKKSDKATQVFLGLTATARAAMGQNNPDDFMNKKREEFPELYLEQPRSVFDQ